MPNTVCALLSISLCRRSEAPRKWPLSGIRKQQRVPAWVITEKTSFIGKSTLLFTYIFIPKMPLAPSLFFFQTECSDHPFYHHALSTRCKGPTLLFPEFLGSLRPLFLSPLRDSSFWPKIQMVVDCRVDSKEQTQMVSSSIAHTEVLPGWYIHSKF